MGLGSFSVNWQGKQNGRFPLLSLLTIPAVLLALYLLPSPTTSAAPPTTTLTVNTNDDSDDGDCDAAHCSLREAINTANNLPGPETIHFTIPATETIKLTIHTQLPVITDTLTINGDGQTVSATGNSRAFEIGAGTAVTVTHLTIRDGYLNDQNGAGFLNWGDLTLIDSTLTWNDADGYTGRGGAVYNDSGRLFVLRTTLVDNATGFGVAGIMNVTGQVIVINSTFSSNNAASGIGGILSEGGSVVINHSTFFDNGSADISSDLYNSGDLYLSNTILATGCHNFGSIMQNLNNLVIDGACDAAFSGDPLLGPLQNYGGPTATHIVLAGSPAIDNAAHTYCPETDQRGVSRPDGPACDIGSFEGYFSPTAVTLTDFDGVQDQTNRSWLMALPAAALLALLLLRKRKHSQI
jgi:CSLREA domain-containing protein